MSGPTLGSDGVWYAGSRPVEAVRGRWRRGAAWLGRALTAPIRWAGATGKRAISSLPWVAGGPRPSVVNSESAIRLIPLFACVRILADQIASLPLQAYRKNGDRREQISPPRLVDQPAARDDLFQWLHKCVVSLALRGNAYGLIVERDGFGFPTMIEWLNPDEVYVDELRPTMPVYYWLGHRVPTEDIVHIPWFVMPGKVVGLSPVAAFATSIGVGIAATQYGAQWFDNGGTPPGVMKNTTKTLNPGEAETVSERLVARIRAGKPLVIGSDWDFTALKVSPEESQFIETMKMNATQIAAIYGVPAEKVGGETGGSLNYTTVEANQLDMATSTLRPWLVRLESAFSRLMPERVFLRFNADAMIRTSLLDRYKAHDLAIAAGWRNRDEVRAIEDLPPIPGGAGQEFSIGGRPPVGGQEDQ
ncbi:MAG TPA: phage portal protein [Nocardioides sp.]|nr:phage portal protein [Nocardioides sp.]